MSSNDLARRFGLRSETIVDVMNGDVVLRVSDLDSHAFGAKIEVFDEALHELSLARRSSRANIPIALTCAYGVRRPLRSTGCARSRQRFDPNRTLNPGCFVDGI